MRPRFECSSRGCCSTTAWPRTLSPNSIGSKGVRLGGSPRLASLMLRGEAALSAGDFEAAEAAFAQAVRRARLSPAAVAGLVAARLSLGDPKGAAQAARTLLERAPAGWEPEWRYWLGPALEYPEMFQAMKDEVREPAVGGGGE